MGFFENLYWASVIHAWEREERLKKNEPSRTFKVYMFFVFIFFILTIYNLIFGNPLVGLVIWLPCTLACFISAAYHY